MAVNIKHVIFIVCSLFFILCSLVLTTGHTKEQNRIVTMAKERYKDSYNDYLDKFGFCKGLASTNEITDKNKKILLSLDLTLHQLQGALTVLKIEANNNCIKESLGRLLISREEYLRVLKVYDLKDDGIDMSLTIADMYYKLLIEFMAFPAEISGQITNIKQLHKPFPSHFMEWKKD